MITYSIVLHPLDDGNQWIFQGLQDLALSPLIATADLFTCHANYLAERFTIPATLKGISSFTTFTSF